MSKDDRKKIRTHNDLEVYRLAMETSMSLFESSRSFLKEERYSLTDQMRKSSRSVCANIAEAWRKRRYEAHFVSKLSDAEAEAAETQVWIETRSNASIWTGKPQRRCISRTTMSWRCLLP